MRTSSGRRRVAVVAGLMVLVTAAVTATTLMLHPGSGKVALASNFSLVVDPYNLGFADLDGDGTKEFIQFGANKLFGFKADLAATPVLHAYYRSDIQRVLVGHFATSGREHVRDDVCAILASGELNCAAPNPVTDGLWWWFSQPNFVGVGELPLVGDFDGNGSDDILVYAPSTGALRMYTTGADGKAWFSQMPHFALGDLTSVSRRDKQFVAGEFGRTGGRTDLVMLDPASGVVTRFDAVTDERTGDREFRKAFATRVGAVSGREALTVARLDGGLRDSLVLRDRTTGTLRAKRAAGTDGGDLQDLPGVDLAGIAKMGPGYVHFRTVAQWPGEAASATRSDVLLLTPGGDLRRWDARADGTRLFYRQAYRKPAPRLDRGWHSVIRSHWYVVPCHIDSPQATLRMTRTDTWWKKEFALEDPNGLGRYFWEQTYGTLDISGVHVTKPVTVKPKDGVTLNTGDVNAACREAAGLDTTTAKVLAYTDVPGFQGWPGGLTVSENEGFWRPGGGIQLSGFAHEMGHALGLGHAGGDYDDGFYGDKWSVMGFDGASCFIVGHNDCAPAGLNAYERSVLNGMSAAKIIVRRPDGTHHTERFTIGGLDRPEATGGDARGPGYLTVWIQLPQGVDRTCATIWGHGNIDADTAARECGIPNKYLSVELREARGWDRNHDTSGVMIHKAFQDFVGNQPASIVMNAAQQVYQAGQVYSGDGITVRVLSIDTQLSRATVEVSY